MAAQDGRRALLRGSATSSWSEVGGREGCKSPPLLNLALRRVLLSRRRPLHPFGRREIYN